MIASTSTGRGYWIVKPDGAVYTFGDAQLRRRGERSRRAGAAGRSAIDGHEIVGIAGVGTDGYWLTSDDGSVYSYGSANYYGRPDR